MREENLIVEYIELQDLIARRSFNLGRALRAYKHYGCFGYKTPLATPYAAQIDKDYVAIAVGMTENNEVGVILVPVPLFENGSEGEIRTWITHSNAQHSKSAEDVQSEKDATTRKNELEILHELMAKYPNE